MDGIAHRVLDHQSAAIVRPVKEPLREFLAALPTMLRWWVLIGTPLGLIAFLLFRQWDAVEALAKTVTVLVVGISFLGFWWAWLTRMSWRRALFAVLWWLVTLLPTLGLALFLAEVIRWLLGAAGAG